jgi:ABC-2 type transport system permease protein
MRAFRTLLSKEFLEQRRTSKLVVILAVFLITGLISPLLAKYTPALLRAIPNMPPGFAEAVPEPTVADSIAQYIKNITQFGILLVIILNMGAIAQEKERGTAAMLLVKPVRRSMVILAKMLAGVSTIVVGLCFSSLACLIYTAILFEPLPVMKFATLNLLMGVYLGVFLAMTVLVSTLARTQSMAAMGAFGGLAILLILGSLPRLDQYMPGRLIKWGSELLVGNAEAAWGALFISLVLIVLAIGLACFAFERQEI